MSPLGVERRFAFGGVVGVVGVSRAFATSPFASEPIAAPRLQILKCSSFEQTATPFRTYLASCFPQVAVNCVQVREFGAMSRSGESIHQSTKYSLDGTFVNVRVGSVQIAQRFRESVRRGFESKPFVAGARSEGPIDRKSKLEGHLESWSRRRIAVKLDPPQIVKRISASANQVDDSFEPSSRAGNLNCRSGSQSERAQTSHKGQVEILVTVVVRDVEECGLLLSARAHRATSLETGSRSRIRLPFALHWSGGRISRFF
jgi:hypothetical protein